jgi:hypothetical protein
MQRDAGIPSTVVTVIEAALILAAVTAQALRLGRAGGGEASIATEP